MNGTQFYRGENVKFTVAPDENEVFTASTPSAAVVYPDGLDKSAEGAAAQIIRAERSVSGDNTVFTIPYTSSYNMECGDYTIEIIYGDASNRSIAVYRSAFQMKRSAQELLQIDPTDNTTTNGSAD